MQARRHERNPTDRVKRLYDAAVMEALRSRERFETEGVFSTSPRPAPQPHEERAEGRGDCEAVAEQSCGA